ncbi:hypothetical protein CTAYLR_003493 [Chrysophaeum taylorii]|uniref:histidine kinase n=1 Tax=Chrysophaeum taylorii TaxID=2483200 RepID=A0AAD7XNC9_9STRA|nr:hypothetical protein CTAYLR_003493 [Chrysophaeum taylorii]
MDRPEAAGWASTKATMASILVVASLVADAYCISQSLAAVRTTQSVFRMLEAVAAHRRNLLLGQPSLLVPWRSSSERLLAVDSTVERGGGLPDALARDYVAAYVAFQQRERRLVMRGAAALGANTTSDDVDRYSFDRLNDLEKALTARLDAVSTASVWLVFKVSVVLAALNATAFAALAIYVFALRAESGAEIAAKEKLAHQQAHEKRNKYAPAIYYMQQFLEATEQQNPEVESFLMLAKDVRAAIELLREVEETDQARLDMYKILRGNYVTHLETFDAIAALSRRIGTERTIARAQKEGRLDVNFRVEVPAGCGGDLQIRTDLYVLSHVLSNLISNARKYTYSGEVAATFVGQQGDILVFRVRDSGSGIPADIASNMFCREVATGDNRGTGLALDPSVLPASPSCALFCRAAGGYIKLKKTRQASTTQSGMSEFEFGLAGTVVVGGGTFIARAAAASSFRDLPPPPCSSSSSGITRPPPKRGLPVIIVDDSEVNRRCVVRSLTRVERLLEASGLSFEQFETVEAAQPTIRDVHERGQFAVVVVDENMQSRGGKLTGTDAIRWMVCELRFRGVIISASGDPAASRAHLKLGAHLAWGKPLPPSSQIAKHLTELLPS